MKTYVRCVKKEIRVVYSKIDETGKIANYCEIFNTDDVNATENASARARSIKRSKGSRNVNVIRVCIDSNGNVSDCQCVWGWANA